MEIKTMDGISVDGSVWSGDDFGPDEGGSGSVMPANRSPVAEAAAESQILDAAARQRMLNQRFAKEIYASLLGERVSYQETLNLLRETATALERGGEVRLTDRLPVLVPPAATEELAAAFRRQLELISEMEAVAARMTGRGRTISLQAQPGITELTGVCEEFQTVANRATVLVSERLTAAWEERRGGVGIR